MIRGKLPEDPKITPQTQTSDSSTHKANPVLTIISIPHGADDSKNKYSAVLAVETNDVILLGEITHLKNTFKMCNVISVIHSTT